MSQTNRKHTDFGTWKWDSAITITKNVEVVLELKSKSWMIFKKHNRESLTWLQQVFNKHLDFHLNAAGEGSEGSEGHIIGKWRKEDLCYVVAESMVTLCPAVMWKTELVSDRVDI